MKLLLILFSMVASTFAGVGYLTPNEEQDALRLYRNYCSGNSDGGSAGRTFIYCKKAREDYREDVNHLVRVSPREGEQRQVIFVQPPSYYYRHNVTLTGARNGQQRAIIYVLPQKNTHTVEHSDLRDGNQAPLKPQLFFLKNDINSIEVSPGNLPPSNDAVAIESDDNRSSNQYPILPTPLKSSVKYDGYKYATTPPITKLSSARGGYY